MTCFLNLKKSIDFDGSDQAITDHTDNMERWLFSAIWEEVWTGRLATSVHGLVAANAARLRVVSS